jgi:hypothetical protein
LHERSDAMSTELTWSYQQCYLTEHPNDCIHELLVQGEPIYIFELFENDLIDDGEGSVIPGTKNHPIFGKYDRTWHIITFPTNLRYVRKGPRFVKAKHRTVVSSVLQYAVMLGLDDLQCDESGGLSMFDDLKYSTEYEAHLSAMMLALAELRSMVGHKGFHQMVESIDSIIEPAALCENMFDGTYSEALYHESHVSDHFFTFSRSVIRHARNPVLSNEKVGRQMRKAPI